MASTQGSVGYGDLRMVEAPAPQRRVETQPDQERGPPKGVTGASVSFELV